MKHLVPYPFWVTTGEQRLRFDLSVAIACEIIDAPAGSVEVWAASRVIFNSDLPTEHDGAE